MVNHNLRKLKIFVCVNKLVVVSIILAFSAYTLAIITPDYSVPKTSAGGSVVYDKSGNPMMRADGSLITIGDLNQAIDGIDPDDPQFLSDVASYTDPEGSEQQTGMAGSEMAGIMSGAVLGGALLGGLIGLALKKKNAVDNLKKAIEGDPAAKEELEGFAKEKTNLQELAKSAKKALAELKKVEKSTDKNLETIDKEHEKVNRALEEAKGNHEKVKAQLLEQQKLLDEETAKKTQAEEEQVNAKKALDDSNNDLEAKQKALEEAKSKSGSDDEKKVAIDEAEKALAEAQKAATTAQNNFDEASKKLQEVTAKHALASNQQAELAKNAEEAAKKVTLAQSNVDIVKDSVDQAKNLKDEVVQKKTELEQKLQTAQDSQVELAKRVRDAAEDSVKKAEEEISDVKRQIAEAKKASIQAIGVDDEAKKAADEQVKLLSKQLVQAEDKLKGFKVGLDKADAELKKISSKQAPVSASLAIGADAAVGESPKPTKTDQAKAAAKSVGKAILSAPGTLIDKAKAAIAERKQKNAEKKIAKGNMVDASAIHDLEAAVERPSLPEDDVLVKAETDVKASLPEPVVGKSENQQPQTNKGSVKNEAEPDDLMLKLTKKEKVKAAAKSVGEAILSAPGKLIAKAKSAIDERKQKKEEEKKAKGNMADAVPLSDLEDGGNVRSAPLPGNKPVEVDSIDVVEVSGVQSNRTVKEKVKEKFQAAKEEVSAFGKKVQAKGEAFSKKAKDLKGKVVAKVVKPKLKP